jgi:hypothetical protein
MNQAKPPFCGNQAEPPFPPTTDVLEDAIAAMKYVMTTVHKHGGADELAVLQTAYAQAISHVVDRPRSGRNPRTTYREK